MSDALRREGPPQVRALRFGTFYEERLRPGDEARPRSRVPDGAPGQRSRGDAIARGSDRDRRPETAADRSQVGTAEALRADAAVADAVGAEDPDRVVVVAADDDHEWEPFALARARVREAVRAIDGPPAPGDAPVRGLRAGRGDAQGRGLRHGRGRLDLLQLRVPAVRARRPGAAPFRAGDERTRGRAAGSDGNTRAPPRVRAVRPKLAPARRSRRAPSGRARARRSNRDASLPENQICVAQAGDMLATAAPNLKALEAWGEELLPGGGLQSCFFVDDLFFAAYNEFHGATVYNHPWKLWLFREAKRRKLSKEPAFEPCRRGGCSPVTIRLRYPDGLAMGHTRETHSENCARELAALGWWPPPSGAAKFRDDLCRMGDF